MDVVWCVRGIGGDGGLGCRLIMQVGGEGCLGQKPKIEPPRSDLRRTIVNSGEGPQVRCGGCER